MYNPFFKKPEKRRPWKKIIIFSSLIIVLFIAFIFLSPVFLIREINIENNQTLDKELIKTEVQNSLSGRSYVFLYSEEKIKEHLTSVLPIENVQTKAWLPNKLIVTVFERTPYVQVQSGEKLFILDRLGVVMPENTATTGLVKMTILESIATSPGQKIIDPEIMKKFIEINDKVKSETKFSIENIELEDRNAKTPVHITNAGWKIYFDINGDIEKQIIKLKTVLQEQIKDGVPIEYIDLRFEDRVYYK